MIVYHNGFSFEQIRTYNNKVVIEIKEDGCIHHSYITEKIENITTNFGGGFKEWVKDQY